MKDGIITISREYGSGGRMIGERLAILLNIPFYDKELITLAAQSSPIHSSFFEHAEENGSSGITYPMNPGLPFDLPLNDKVFLAQSAVIKAVAAKGSCVIVGRCADYVLRERKDLLKVFVFADEAIRKNRAVAEYGDNAEKISRKLAEVDKKRAAYYNHYAQAKWGKLENYHIGIDSGRIGIDGAIAAIREAYLSEN